MGIKDQEPCQEVEKRLDQKSRLSVVTEVEHQINWTFLSLKVERETAGFPRGCASRGL